jgi:hypothetical protein
MRGDVPKRVVSFGRRTPDEPLVTSDAEVAPDYLEENRSPQGDYSGVKRAPETRCQQRRNSRRQEGEDARRVGTGPNSHPRKSTFQMLWAREHPLRSIHFFENVVQVTILVACPAKRPSAGVAPALRVRPVGRRHDLS